MVINLLERAVDPHQHSFQCPPEFENELAALALVIIHVMQSFPDKHEEVSPRFMLFISLSASRVRIADTVASVVLPRDIPNGVERLLKISEKYSNSPKYLESLQGINHRPTLEALIADRLQQTNSLKELIREAKNVPATGDEEREAKRCEVLAVLPCSFVGCLSFPPPGKNVIDSKKCSNCKIAHYRSARCQKKDWKHTQNCMQIDCFSRRHLIT